MDNTVVTALAGVLGSLVGGTATAATAWVTARTRSKRQLITAEMKKREALYGEFHQRMLRTGDRFIRTKPA